MGSVQRLVWVFSPKVNNEATSIRKEEEVDSNKQQYNNKQRKEDLGKIIR